MEGKKKQQPTNSFVAGAIALLFLIIGYEAALFMHRAAVLRLAANRDRPDTVYVMVPSLTETDSSLSLRMTKEKLRTTKNERKTTKNERKTTEDERRMTEEGTVIRKEAPREEAVVEVREKAAPRKVENFRFNPNTVSVEDLCRLGFSRKQAQAIENYRLKGGRFPRKKDFAKSFVVADSVYARLEPYIDIPLIDLNRADSVELLALPGIGPYFSGKIVRYREKIKGYTSVDQLLEIYRFDQEKLDGIRDLVTVSP